MRHGRPHGGHCVGHDSTLPDRRPSVGRGVPRGGIRKVAAAVKGNREWRAAKSKLGSGRCRLTTRYSLFAIRWHQNFAPTAMRRLFKLTLMPLMLGNPTYSHSPRRNMFSITKTS